MTTLGISEANILEQEEEVERTVSDDQGVRLFYNQTDPNMIRDGVDSITVVQQTEESYLIVYWGCLLGYLRVTADGLAELGEKYLADRGDPPRWLLDQDTVDGTELPWRVPDALEVNPKIICDLCDETTPAKSIVTPFEREAPADRFCRDCWDDPDNDIPPA